MTFICLVLGCALIAYGVCYTFVPVVGKEDLDREQRIPITTKERPVMISEIVDVKIPGGDHPENNPVEENVRLIKPIFTYYDVPLSDEIQRYITDQCLEKFGTIELDGYNLPKLVMNIIRWESGFNQDNDNGKCCGLMSVTHNLSDTIREEEHITNLIEPDQNIRAGIRILKNMYDQARKSYNGKRGLIDVALDGYHCGYHITGFTSEYTDNIKSTYEITKERS